MTLLLQTPYWMSFREVRDIAHVIKSDLQSTVKALCQKSRLRFLFEQLSHLQVGTKYVFSLLSHQNDTMHIFNQPQLIFNNYSTTVRWIWHTCPIHLKCVESSVCIDKSSWQKSCREIHEVILTGSWQTLQEVWLQSPEMVILREWGVEMSSSRHDSTRVDTTRYFQKSTRLYMAKNALADKSTKEMKQEAMQCIPRSVNLCRQMTRFK